MKTQAYTKTRKRHYFVRGHRTRFFTAIVLVMTMIIAYAVPMGAMAMDEEGNDLDSITPGPDSTVIEELPDEPGDESAGGSTEEPGDEPAEQTGDEPKEEPAEELADEPAEEPAEIVALGTIAPEGSNLFDWTKTPEGSAMIFPGNATSSSNSKIFTWSWSNIENWLPETGLSADNVWDLTTDSHASDKYVPNSSVTSFNAASWKNTNGRDSSLRRFQASFTMPDGFSSIDNYYIDSTRTNGEMGVNDLMFVFMYPAGYELNNDNYLEQFAFWAGDINEAITYPASKSFHGYDRIIGKKDTTYNGGTAPAGKILGTETLYHTDGNYFATGIATTSLNEAIRIASQNKDIRNWTIDIITADYYDGGGMDAPYIAYFKNPENVALMVNYWLLDDNGQNPVPAYKNGKHSSIIDITKADIGSNYILNADQLNANRPDEYGEGVQLSACNIKSGVNNIIDVYYAPNGAQISTNNVSFVSGENGKLIADNALSSGDFITNSPWINLPWSDDSSLIPVATADEGYKFIGWQYENDNSESIFLASDATGNLLLPEGNLDRDFIFTATFAPDENQTKRLSYSVEYYLNGTIDKDMTNVVTEEVWVNDKNEIKVNANDINVVNAFGENNIFEKTAPSSIPTIVDNESVIDVYYVTKVVPQDPDEQYLPELPEDIDESTPPETPATPGTPTTPTQPTNPPANPVPPVVPAAQTPAPQAPVALTIVPTLAPTSVATTPAPATITPLTPVTDNNATTIAPLSTPQNATTNITDQETPRASTASWALLNLILTIITGLLMVSLFVTYLFKRKDRYEDNPDIDENVKKHLGVRLVSILVTAIAILVFALTEDMSLPMQFVDEYTIWMAVILIAQLIVTVFSKKKYVEEEIYSKNA